DRARVLGPAGGGARRRAGGQGAPRLDRPVRSARRPGARRARAGRAARPRAGSRHGARPDRRPRRPVVRPRDAGASVAAPGRGRLPRRAARDLRRRGRHRGAGLGDDADADVHAVGGAEGLRRRHPGPERGRGGGDQGRRPRDPRPVRVRLPAAGDGGAPPRAHLALRRAGAPPHQLRVGVRLPGGRRGDQHRGPRGRHQDGRLPRVGGRRAAREQDQLGGPPDTHPLGRGGVVTAGALAVQEPRDRPENAQEPPLPDRGGQAAGGERCDQRHEERRELRESDPELRLPAVHHGQRPPDGAQDPRRAEGHGRRHRPLHRGVPQSGQLGRGRSV
ncbi:MAG: Peptide chain release factor 2 @ programmed frameshift-containing, partial [uncultured Gemmatimonadaceae bacterium]